MAGQHNAALEAAEALAASAGATFSPGSVLTSSTSRISYELEAHLGSGAFGDVWQCSEIVPAAGSSMVARPLRAVKIVKTDDFDSVREEVRRHKRAVQAAGDVFVPKFFECSEAWMVGRPNPAVHIIVMQLIKGMAANSVDRPENARTRETMARVIMHDVLVSLQRLHGNGVVHRDVKPANVLIENTGNCYLCDFGVSLFLDEVPEGQEMDQVGTPLYMAPEMLKTMPTRYNQKVDVWSLGIMGYELELGRTPIQQHAYDLPTQGYIFSSIQTMTSPIFASSFTLQYQGLVQSCLEVQPEVRLSSAELLEEHAPSVSGRDRRALVQLLGP